MSRTRGSIELKSAVESEVERDLVVARALQTVGDHRAHLVERALTYGTRDHPGLAEAAASGAAPEHLDVQSIVNDLGQRHELVLRIRPIGQVGHRALLDPLGHVVVLRSDRDQRGALVADVVHRRHVHPWDRGERVQHGLAGSVTAAPADLPRPHDLGDLGHDFFTVTEHHEIQEVGDRLRVVRAVPARADERVFGSSIGGPDGHPGEIDAVEHVRVDELGRQVERDQIEVGRRTMGVDGEQGDVAGAQLCFEVDPRRIGPFRHRIGALVQDLVEDLQALVGQADLVGVRVNEQPGDFAGAVLGTDRTVLEADVASGFLDLGQQGFQL